MKAAIASGRPVPLMMRRMPRWQVVIALISR
jgi:hypothetical protein